MALADNITARNNAQADCLFSVASTVAMPYEVVGESLA
jgi:hypothetical protein